jgi:endoglucanase
MPGAQLPLGLHVKVRFFETLSPPAGQPAQKSYTDFNDSWPLDSWSVTEPDDGYQAQYVRLLSKFVP